MLSLTLSNGEILFQRRLTYINSRFYVFVIVSGFGKSSAGDLAMTEHTQERHHKLGPVVLGIFGCYVAIMLVGYFVGGLF